MFCIEKVFKDNEQYNQVIGNLGDAFVEAISWLFTEDDDELRIPYRITTPTFMTCVRYFICGAKGKQPKRTLYDYISQLESPKGNLKWSTDFDCVDYTRQNGKDMFIFSSMSNFFISSVIWCTYIYFLMLYELSSENEKFKKITVLLNDILSSKVIVKDDYDFLMSKVNETMCTFIKGLDSKSTETVADKYGSPENKDAEKALRKYISDPIYGQCYEGVVSVLSMLGRDKGIIHTLDEYVKVFEEAKFAVEGVLNSPMPEIAIANAQAHIIDKYPEIQNGNLSIVTPKRIFGCLIEMVFIIVLWDKMPNKSKLVITAFEDCRSFVENHDTPYLYTDNPMWKLIAERISYRKAPRIEDLQAENERLKQTLEQKDEMIKNLEAGYQKTEEGFKPYSSEKRIHILKYVLGIGETLAGEEREGFKNICRFMTKADDSTLERLLSQGSLVKMKEDDDELLKEFPILKP